MWRGLNVLHEESAGKALPNRPVCNLDSFCDSITKFAVISNQKKNNVIWWSVVHSAGQPGI